MNLTVTDAQARWLILGVALFAVIYNAFLPLHGDEAYYWVWSNNLQAGYYDHAPMIAFFIKAATWISDAEWGIRLVNIVSLSISAWFLYRTARTHLSQEAAGYTLLIFLSIPLVHGGYIITTPDAPLILFWTLSLHFALDAITTDRTRSFVLTGLFLGLAMLSKYTAILLAASILLYLLLFDRRRLLDSKTWMAVALAALIVSPMLWWNYQNDWISFLFQLEHGGMGNTELSLKDFGDYFGGQFAIFSPVFMGIVLVAAFKRDMRQTPAERLILVAFALPLAFFVYKSCYEHMELNYGAPAYIAGALLTASAVARFGWRRWFAAGLILALVLSLTARGALLFALVHVQDRMVGFKEAITLLAKERRDGDALYGNHLTTAALLSYYLPDHPRTSVATDTRFSQYDLWDTTLRDGLVLSYYNAEKNLHKRFASVETVAIYDLFKGDKKFRTFYIFRVADPKQPKL